MTISSRSPHKQPPVPPTPLGEPLVASVRVYLAHELPPAPVKDAPPTAPPEPCHADIAADTARGDIKGINFERLHRNDLNNNAGDSSPPRPTVAAAATTMPSAAERMQRQPLLARNVPHKEPERTTDDSTSDQEPSPARAHDFVVDIGGAAGAAGRDDRYPKEILKTIVSFLFLFGCVCINMVSLSLVHERLPDRNTTVPLPDAFLDNVAPRDWALAVSEYLIMASTTVAMAVVVFHKHRFIVARRLFFIIGLLYLYRSVTMYATVLPVSSSTYYCSPKSNSTAPLMVVRRMFYLISGFGLSINGKHTYCGDYIYSGHTMVLVLSYLVVAEYSPRRLWPAHWALWASALLGVLFVLLAHGHYTVDVIIAYYITTRLFWTVHALAGGAGAVRGGHWLRREWWYPLWAYFERNVRGPVPRRYDLPLPWAWPRPKIFSRLS